MAECRCWYVRRGVWVWVRSLTASAVRIHENATMATQLKINVIICLASRIIFLQFLHTAASLKSFYQLSNWFHAVCPFRTWTHWNYNVRRKVNKNDHCSQYNNKSISYRNANGVRLNSFPRNTIACKFASIYVLTNYFAQFVCARAHIIWRHKRFGATSISNRRNKRIGVVLFLAREKRYEQNK